MFDLNLSWDWNRVFADYFDSSNFAHIIAIVVTIIAYAVSERQ